MEKWRKKMKERKLKRERENSVEKEAEGGNDSDLYIPLKQRKIQEEAKINQIVSQFPKKSLFDSDSTVTTSKGSSSSKKKYKSLFKIMSSIRKTQPKKTKKEIEVEKEEKLLNQVSVRKALIPTANIGKTDDNSQNKNGSKPGQTMEIKRFNWGWKPPSFIEKMSHFEVNEIRRIKSILVTGKEIANPILNFGHMRLPKVILDYLENKNVNYPTPIQSQSIPVLLSGRDLIGVSYTGSGKTFSFVIPLLIVALIEEKKLSVKPGEGPFCLVLTPSRELARQIFDVIKHICSHCFPFLRTILCIGGTSLSEQEKVILKGFHICVSTPGRLISMLSNKSFSLEFCKYLVLDEADRLVDIGFEDSIRTIFDFFRYPKQTVLFSATMAPKIQNFAKTALRDPVIVNVGRAGASSQNIKQEILYVDEGEKYNTLLDVLQKTGPPVLIFSSDKNEVDNIFEFLLLKELNVTSIHGSKEQIERNYAVDSFKKGKKDILVATGIASKGLDFPDIKHVINFDMPKEIENYVHRIGRTGRWGNKGVSTTFVNSSECNFNTLLDLKHLLKEAKQEIPDFLDALKEEEGVSERGCSYCGGLGHTIITCEKLERDSKKNLQKISERNTIEYI